MEAATALSAEEAPEQLLDRVQELQARLESAGDPDTRALAESLVSAVVQMYGAGLEGVMRRLMAGGETGAQLAVGLTEDPFLATLLLIHDLHPVSLADRVQGALDSVRPYMESHGGSVELLGLENGIARIHLRGSCSDCSASSVTLELAIKQALEQAAPDLEGLEVEGMAEQAVPGVGLPMATGTAPSPGMELPMVTVAPAWVEVPAGAPGEGSLSSLSVSGHPLLIANVEGTLLAYTNRCADCGGPLGEGRLSAGALACPGCGRQFFLPRAGRSMDDDALQLEPVPLLREEGRVRVALR
jgi:Fe-S cluster biogenesis protein NfuA/nitrite reductase/ring-hydroxylating ferredoxin subunit